MRSLLATVLVLVTGISFGQPSFTPQRQPGSSLDWYSADVLTLEGRGFDDVPTTFSRLPARAEKSVPKSVWHLSKNTTGLALRFRTNSTTIGASWDGGEGMNHMAPTGSNGLDLYVKSSDSPTSVGSWKFLGVGRPKDGPSSGVLTSKAPEGMNEYLLYPPLYAPVTDMKIGVANGAKLEPVYEPYAGKLPVVFYGTSITQGGCASRAGMCHVAILGRWVNREVINLGFSGSGKSEPEVADLVAEVEASAYVLEPLPNMTVEHVRQRLGNLTRTIRTKRPNAPILLVENPLFASDGPPNVALRDIMDGLRREGMKNLYHLPAEPQLAGIENGTVDGVHPTDLGFYRMAAAYLPTLKLMLGE